MSYIYLKMLESKNKSFLELLKEYIEYLESEDTDDDYFSDYSLEEEESSSEEW